MKIYVAGKVDPNSVFGTHDWRGNFLKEIEELTGTTLDNLDPTKSPNGLELKEDSPDFIFGRDAYLISIADLVIVNLTDDISVGGSQEMMIAKYFNKPLLGLARKEGKFNKSEKTISGNVYKNWKDPFVYTTCDFVAETIEQLATFIKNDLKKIAPKDISRIKKLADNFLADHLNKN